MRAPSPSSGESLQLDPLQKRRILVIVALAGVFGLLYLGRGALFPFIISGISAYLLYPVVKTIESLMPWRERWPGASHISAIFVIYVLTIAVAAGLLALIVPPAFREATDFLDSLPELYSGARDTVEGWNRVYSERIPEDIRLQIEESLSGLGTIVIDIAEAILAQTVSTVSNTFTLVIGLAIVPVLLFYFLKDKELAIESLYALLPKNTRRHTRNVVGIINQALGAYIRAQLILMFFVGLLVFLGLFLLGIKFPLLLGLVAGVFELVPVVGPLLGAIPGILVTLATSPSDIVWVVLIYFGVQLIENSLLVPRIQGDAVNLHPAIIMVVLIVASETFGVFGVIAAVPVAGVSRDVFKYFYSEWSDGLQVEGSAEPEEKPTTPAPDSPSPGSSE